VAYNDLAPVGRILVYLSHSPGGARRPVFVTEDTAAGASIRRRASDGLSRAADRTHCAIPSSHIPTPVFLCLLKRFSSCFNPALTAMDHTAPASTTSSRTSGYARNTAVAPENLIFDPAALAIIHARLERALRCHFLYSWETTVASGSGRHRGKPPATRLLTLFVYGGTRWGVWLGCSAAPRGLRTHCIEPQRTAGRNVLRWSWLADYRNRKKFSAATPRSFLLSGTAIAIYEWICDEFSWLHDRNVAEEASARLLTGAGSHSSSTAPAGTKRGVEETGHSVSSLPFPHMENCDDPSLRNLACTQLTEGALMASA